MTLFIYKKHGNRLVLGQSLSDKTSKQNEKRNLENFVEGDR